MIAPPVALGAAPLAACGMPEDGCPSKAAQVAGRITTLQFRNAGVVRGCNARTTGTILFQ